MWNVPHFRRNSSFLQILWNGLILKQRHYKEIIRKYNNERQWYSMVDFVTIFNKEDIGFTFKDGTEIKV